jgi:putative ABC transport system permease protein
MPDGSPKLPPGVRRLFRLSVTRSRGLRDTDDEMRFHLAMRINELRALGMSERDAAAEAQRRFGDLDQHRADSLRHATQQARQARRRSVMRGVGGDVRYALRTLARSPVFTASTIAVLALGIGMATAMISLYATVFVDRLPVAQQDRVVIAHPLDRRGTHLDVPFSYLPLIAGDSAVFRGVAGVYHLGVQPIPFVENGVAVELGAVTASANYFDVLGTRPALGRLFSSEDGRPGAAPVIVLSYRAWRRQFGGDSSVLGRTLLVPYTEKPARIVGVAPAGFAYPTGSDAWMPAESDTSTATLQADIVARLAPNVGVGTAQSQLFALTQRANPFARLIAQEHLSASAFEISAVDMRTFADTILGGARFAALALTLAAGLLLLIACVNIGNLVLVRLLGRTGEIAVRRALGGTYADITRQFGVEHALLGASGGILGLLLALGVLRAVRAAAPPQLPRSDTLGSFGMPLVIAALATVVTTALFGIIPAMVASRVDSYAALRADLRAGSESKGKRRARRWLVSTQMALALVMLSGAALLVRTLSLLQAIDLGYAPSHLSILSFTGPQSDLGTNERIFDVAKQLLTRIEATPGVIAATPVESEPFKGQSFFIMKLGAADEPQAEQARDVFVPFEFVGPGYFRTFDTPILSGRGFSESDTKGAANVVVISETLAHRLWPNENAVGKQVRQALGNSLWTVIGVARDTHFRELEHGGPVAYFDWNQVAPFWNGFVAVRTRNSLAASLPSIRAATRDVDPNLVVYDAQTMDQLLAAPLGQPRLSALLMASFSGVALLLSAIGLYGVIASGVRQQTRDLGVRIALGATGRDIRRVVLGDAAAVVVVGALIGVAGSIAGGRLLASQLFGVSPVDPLSLGAAAALLLVIAAGAALVPTYRAMRIDPVTALRSE